jgi:hypothetical protein
MAARSVSITGSTASTATARISPAFDGTTVSMPDTPENQSAFPQNSEQKPGLGFPVARIGELTMLRGLLPLIHAMMVSALRPHVAGRTIQR